MARFGRPFNNMLAQDQFSLREVGMTHPDNASFLRIKDNGDIELSSAEGCGIILHAATGNVTVVGNEIRFITNDGNTIRWNSRRFNSRSVVFTQPALVEMDDDEQYSPYSGAEAFYVEDED